MRCTLSATLLALAAVIAIGLAAYTHAASRFSPKGALVDRSVADLRRAGPAGLRALLDEYDRTADASLIPAIDAVAAQRDARWSRLYWYTDLAAAKSAAIAEHKPILALRMLGNLTDEYSCANSRFFRTVLYANANVSSILRDRYILVWTSERPVPVVTIDYGDGRILKRTITGNSIHYILNSRGDVIDAIPGLYDPQTFATILTNAIAPATSADSQAPGLYRQAALTALDADWSAVSAPAPAYGVSPATIAQLASTRAGTKNKVESPLLRVVTPNTAPIAPDAREAADLAISKMRIERPLVNATAPANPPHAAKAARAAEGKSFVETPMIRAMVPAAPAQPALLDSEVWAALAARRPAILDQRSIDLIRSQSPATYVDTAKLDQVVSNFQQAIAIDTLRNNHLFRRQILGWLQDSAMPMSLLNDRVYSDLFLTPRSDPWLGLVPDATYSALTGDGCTIN